ncbi:MAG TPA: hypothetical protein EYP78_02085, partial [Candidatus Omnitrophica bacterium]|nr:hypothetical protein [Candidatus Omnitrophota bacterium]
MLIEVMDEDLVVPELKSRSKDEVIREMASKFKEAGVVKDEERLIQDICMREKIESTAIGKSIAIPHARSDAVEELAVA